MEEFGISGCAMRRTVSTLETKTLFSFSLEKSITGSRTGVQLGGELQIVLMLYVILKTKILGEEHEIKRIFAAEYTDKKKLFLSM